MIQHQRAVGVDVQQAPCLIQMRRSERNAKLHRRERDAALHIGTFRVERTDRAPAAVIVGALLEIRHDVIDHVVDDRLMIVRDVARGSAVEVHLAYVQRIFAERVRDVVDQLLDAEHALRSTETAECSL